VRRGVTCLSGSGGGTPGLVPLSPHSVRERFKRRAPGMRLPVERFGGGG
jgi:hypothetical protein